MTQPSKAYLLVPLLYIGVILGLLFLQFSGGERFTRSIGQLTLLATRGSVSEDGVPEVRALSLGFGGLNFAFDEEDGLIVERRSSLSDKRVTGFRSLDNGFVVEFEEGFRLTYLTADDPARELQIRLTVPEAASDLVRVSIPFTLGAGVTTEAAASGRGGTSFAVVSLQNSQYYLSAPPQAVIDIPNRRIVLQPEAAEQAVRYVEATGNTAEMVSRWFDDPALAVADTVHASRVNAYVDAAYAGWTSGRYHAASLTWTRGSEPRAFSEEALTAYLAEAWLRGEYDRAYAEMRRAVDLHSTRLGILSSAFLGNLRRVYERFAADEQTQRALLEEQLAASDPALFQRPDLFMFAAVRGSEALYEEVLRFTAEVDLRSVDAITAVGMLANAFLYETPDVRADEAGGRFSDLIGRTILASIVRMDGRFYLQTAPGQVDVYQTVLAGAALNAYGVRRRDARVTSVGRNLVASVLALADRNGLLPATLLVRGETLESGGGVVAPESIYAFLNPAASYPRLIPFYEEFGSGHWILSPVNVDPVRLTSEEWQFALAYPRRRTFYLVMQGVPAFARMELFGQTWRDAPDFEIYSKGRHYLPDSRTMLIKYSDDSERRELAFYF